MHDRANPLAIELYGTWDFSLLKNSLFMIYSFYTVVGCCWNGKYASLLKENS